MKPATAAIVLIFLLALGGSGAAWAHVPSAGQDNAHSSVHHLGSPPFAFVNIRQAAGSLPRFMAAQLRSEFAGPNSVPENHGLKAKHADMHCDCCGDCPCGQCQGNCGCVAHAAITLRTPRLFSVFAIYFDAVVMAISPRAVSFPIDTPPD